MSALCGGTQGNKHTLDQKRLLRLQAPSRRGELTLRPRAEGGDGAGREGIEDRHGLSSAI